MADALFIPSEIREDLKRLKEAMKRLSVGYEMFLNQTIRWPPHERRAECEAIIRHYTKYPPRQTSDRFLFNNLMHRYRTNMERWGRRYRALEESGEIRQVGASARELKHKIEDPNLPYTLMKVTVVSESPPAEQLRDLYVAYRQARRARGMAVSRLGYGKFASSMSKHIRETRDKSGGRPLELRVDTVGGKVRIAVRSVVPKNSPEPTGKGSS